MAFVIDDDFEVEEFGEFDEFKVEVSKLDILIRQTVSDFFYKKLKCFQIIYSFYPKNDYPKY